MKEEGDPRGRQGVLGAQGAEGAFLYMESAQKGNLSFREYKSPK